MINQAIIPEDFARDNKGFTLVELMVAMAVSIGVLAAIYTAYTSQQRTYIVQEQVAEMQQNLRAAIYMMAGEIRMAGYDPTNFAGAGIVTAQSGQFSFTADLNNDGDVDDVGEMVEFGFSPADDNDRDGIIETDADGDGIPDARPFGRQVGGAGGYQAIAENIQAVDFTYLDSTGAVTAVPADIRAVQISILARAGVPDRDFLNTDQYFATTVTPVPPGTKRLWPPAAGVTDNYRRRLLITTVQCRNIGI